MTSDRDVGQSVEQSVEQPVEPSLGQGVEQPFLFHCSCGEVIQTSAKKEICPACGETIEVVRCVATPQGNKYTLRISKHRKSVNAEPLLWPLALRPTVAKQGTQQYKVPDVEKKSFYLGLFFMMIAAFSIIGFFEPESYQEAIAFLDPHKPHDCDWLSMPFGDKHCHYDSSTRYVHDKKGEHVVVMWRRMSD